MSDYDGEDPADALAGGWGFNYYCLIFLMMMSEKAPFWNTPFDYFRAENGDVFSVSQCLVGIFFVN